MNTIDRTATIADIVKVNPGTALVFNKHNIDFCCNGNHPLDWACKEADINLDALILELENNRTPNTKWEQVDQSAAKEVINYILHTFHQPLKAEIPAIERLLKKVVRVHGEVHSELLEVQKVFEIIVEELHPHTLKEEQLLFPYIISLEESLTNRSEVNRHFGSVMNPISRMESEHQTIGLLLKKISKLTNHYIPPKDACNSFNALYYSLNKFEFDLMFHIHIENNILHPLAKKIDSEYLKQRFKN